jgi:SAM-dependent methyltransferase
MSPGEEPSADDSAEESIAEDPVSEIPIAEDAYDAIADEYADDVPTNAYNAHLEFPGTTGLVPDVDGQRLLDAGCGTGIYTEWLLDRGADVVGVDVNEAMLDNARETVGDRAEFHRGTLGEPLEFADEDGFDGVVSALAIDYVEDWASLFDEFARVTRPGGFVVFSVVHPLDTLDEAPNYFETEQYVKEWSVDVPCYRRPLGAMFDPVIEAGFRIDEVCEPEPTEEFAEKRPERYETESRNPVFLCVRAVLD